MEIVEVRLLKFIKLCFAYYHYCFYHFFYHSLHLLNTGPLTQANTNLIIGIVGGGTVCDMERVKPYQDMLKPEVQAFIRGIVPDLQIEGRIK